MHSDALVKARTWVIGRQIDVSSNRARLGGVDNPNCGYKSTYLHDEMEKFSLFTFLTSREEYVVLKFAKKFTTPFHNYHPPYPTFRQIS